jgi:hypothetical protein
VTESMTAQNPVRRIEFVQCTMEGEPRGVLAQVDDVDVIVLDTRLTGSALTRTVQDLTEQLVANVPTGSRKPLGEVTR